MILSYHPIFKGNQNRLCAGRLPTPEDEALIRSANAVILPQGVSQALYEMAIQNCSFVFPNYQMRFQYPGKLGQTKLFQKASAPLPPTQSFLSSKNINDFNGFNYPQVLKYDWGGEGQTVFFIPDETALRDQVTQIQMYEKTQGEISFIVQSFIPHQSRTLRCVVIGNSYYSYWRTSSFGIFGTAISSGATIDSTSDPELQRAGKQLVQQFCKKTKINLAGFDLLFSEKGKDPFFLEINYYFGRTGLGGSEAYYQILNTEIMAWINFLGLTL